jgi:hypothetical protein
MAGRIPAPTGIFVESGTDGNRGFHKRHGKFHFRDNFHSTRESETALLDEIRSGIEEEDGKSRKESR